MYKKNGTEIHWLVIKPRPSELFPTTRFQLPKGHLENGESSEEAALREVLEETGIEAKIAGKIGVNKYPLEIGQERVFKIVTYFLMKFVSGKLTQNAEVEELYWLPLDEAVKKLTYANDRQILKKAAEMAGFIFKVD